jgi:hypothetical protein
LASGFVSALDEFGKSLVEFGKNCERLKTCVHQTVELLRRERAQTVDTLVARLASEAHDFSRILPQQHRLKLDQQIQDAKIATFALFMDLERKASETGLPRYQNFLDELFGNSTDWLQASQKSSTHVLTFNYDRLFEMAFISRFRPDTGQYPLYGKRSLNSGLDYVSGDGIDVDPARFAFLKLHGSVGIRVRNEESTGPRYYTCYDGLPGDDRKPINDEMFFAKASNPNPYERDPEPLIVFPTEKPFVAEGTKTLLSFRKYVPAIWEEAKRLVAEATQIWAIGYRFAPMDRKDVLDFLKLASTKKCRRLIVQNVPGTAETICQDIKSRWLEPEGVGLKVEPFPQPF